DLRWTGAGAHVDSALRVALEDSGADDGDVDRRCRPGEPHGHERDEGLPSGDDPRVVAGGEHRASLVEIRGSCIFERCGFHRAARFWLSVKRAARTAIGPRPLPLSWGRTRVTGSVRPAFSAPHALRLAQPYSLSGLRRRSTRQHCPATTHKKARKDPHDGRSGRLSWLRIGFEPSAVGTDAGKG